MEIKPFSGYRYNTQKIKNLNEVIAPPYDVIDDSLQDELYGRHPNNVVRLILNKISPTDSEADNRYTRSAKILAQWKKENILVQEEKPAIYVYHQIFEISGQQYIRKGFMCACRAVPFGYGMVYPHEMTMNAPKFDRLMLTTACKMNFSQIFGLYPDEKKIIQQGLEETIETQKFPFVEAVDDLGVIHRMWVVDDSEAIMSVVKEMVSKPIFIADGHHRYETACNYRMQVDDMGLLTSDHPANYVLMVCVAMEDSGLLVLPTHRLFSGLPEFSSEEIKTKLGNYFTTEDVGNSPNDAHQVWKRIEKEKRQDTIALYTAKDEKWMLTTLTQSGQEKMKETAIEHHPEWCELGVSLLHCLIIETLLENKNYPTPTYLHLVDDVIAELKQGQYPLAALVMPATVEHIKSLSMLGDRMPAKSTYFYPKLIAGFVFNPLE
ncbi:MAG: DUF1015 domain-containing protein [Planctomycetaceae bacterium]|jgi:uncharacterized protein (DUF1015 family)|nr:DUF1015 domain-containing protein [Planctomycetaceae bacterium]